MSTAARRLLYNSRFPAARTSRISQILSLALSLSLSITEPALRTEQAEREREGGRRAELSGATHRRFPMEARHRRARPRPQLDRRNAIKNIDYDASSASTSSSSASSLALDGLSVFTSFRVKGEDGEFDVICRSLGLTPEDFAIPMDAWRSSKARDLTPRLRLQSAAFLASDGDADDELPRDGDGGGLAAGVDSIELESGISILNGSRSYGSSGLEDRVRVLSRRTRFRNKSAGSALNVSRPLADVICANRGDCENCETDNAGGGIRGLRPPVLTPPPVKLLPVVDNVSSTWELLNSFGPQEGPGGDEDSPVCPSNKEDWSDGDDEKVSKERILPRKDDSDSHLSTSVEDKESTDKDEVGNAPSANISELVPNVISEPVRNVSPEGSFRQRITSWQKGERLGSGSFGTVYEGISEDGFFFAIKEVSLLDQGSQGKQSILQLEQEISLLSQFEHENIVRYLGTDKDGKKLYVFLEFMSKGSLATLYHKCKLRDSQVSAFTRQILNGLKYLHDQKVVHRDIKCANILVDASGTVKLADFGLAKATEMNAAKTFIGSPFWMAPEIVNPKKRSSQSNRSYGLEVDIWSLGCTVLEMLTSQRPYPKLDKAQALYKIGKGKHPPLPRSLSSDARDFILTCLQKNPKDRPSAVQLLNHPFVR
ncbi:mitogen-activated protein kinase kinase kinase 1-like isoform X1 [Eucalyptus grandis]|uniref:mitogen-activated protein kinase kinase kinase 1-like isoform X1 n=1 Tax=Eucalyptus grandis TaxID=71139 RepID=UPI00192EFA18|nr:mitogen-activated protein kinase kinase kinase 1-like isoform X1 [Eucalyptus grandis]